MKYLLDTNVLIDIFKKNSTVIENLQRVKIGECCISDITVYELYYGAYRSQNPDESLDKIDKLIGLITIIVTYDAMNEAARQKAQLAAKGMLIEDFDLIIGSTAIVNDLTVVTSNTSHLERLEGISLQNWRMSV